MRRSWLGVRVLLALAVAPATLVAPSLGAPAAPKISGSNATVWNIAAPTPSYTVTGSAPGATLTWTLSGSARKGSGASPLRVRLAGLPTGTYNLDATQSPGGAKARRRVRVDITPPTIAIRQPVDGALYLPGEAVAADYSCGGGAITCTGTLPRGAPLPTAAAGPATFLVAATDAAGNPASQAVAYRVGPVAPTIVGRPPQPMRGTRAVFSWAGGEPGALFTWQVLSGGGVVSQGDTFDATVSLGPLAPGAYAFQVRQAGPDGRAGLFSVADPFTVTQAVVSPLRTTPRVRTPLRLRPAPGATLTGARPVLAWRPSPGASVYNLQIFRVRGASLSKVSSTFPRSTRARVAGLRPGARYAWRVWPYRRSSGYTPEPLGLSYFDLVRRRRPDSIQMLVARRIAQAALRRVNAIEAWLNSGIRAGDLRHAGLGVAVFDPALNATGEPGATGTAAAAVRSIGSGRGPRARGPVRANARELLVTQRIAQSAVRRIDGIEARLKAGLTGGDVVDGSIAAEKLAGGVAVGAPAAAVTALPRSVTVVPARRPSKARVRLTSGQMLISQRISQSAVRRAEALRQRLMFGLSTADFQAGSIGSADLAPSLRGR